MSLGTCLSIAAPYYNLAFVVIVMILFTQLFAQRKNKRVYLKPWKFLLAALCIFIVEEILTILKGAGVISYPGTINGFFEMIIISMFIYMVLLQKENNRRYRK